MNSDNTDTGIQACMPSRTSDAWEYTGELYFELKSEADTSSLELIKGVSREGNRLTVARARINKKKGSDGVTLVSIPVGTEGRQGTTTPFLVGPAYYTVIRRPDGLVLWRSKGR